MQNNDYQNVFQVGQQVVMTDGFGAVDAKGEVMGFEGEDLVVFRDESGEVVKSHGQFLADAEWHEAEYSL